jgi:hypothetical protein
MMGRETFPSSRMLKKLVSIIRLLFGLFGLSRLFG